MVPQEIRVYLKMMLSINLMKSNQSRFNEETSIIGNTEVHTQGDITRCKLVLFITIGDSYVLYYLLFYI